MPYFQGCASFLDWHLSFLNIDNTILHKGPFGYLTGFMIG